MAAKLKTLPWDPSEHLTDRKAIVAYIDAALEDGDPAVVTAVLGDIARAEGMTKIARSAGLTRASLYKALNGDARPEFATVLRVLTALGVRLRAKGSFKRTAAPRETVRRVPSKERNEPKRAA